MKRRVLLVAIAAVIAAAIAVVLTRHGHPQRPPATATRAAPTTGPRPRPRPRATFTWPVYGYDAQRTHAARGLHVRPPFRRIWVVRGDWSLIEFPPVLAAGRLFVGTNHGLVLAVDAADGRVVWRRQFRGCVAASPAVDSRAVYVGFMDAPPCTGTRPSLLVALDPGSGTTLWRFRAGVIESPPLVVGGLVYFGSWDGRIYAVDARTGRRRWSFATHGRVKGGPAYAAGTIYAGSYDGTLYAVDARTGRLRWSAGGGGLGGLYATPSVSDGRVLVGSTDGSVYAFGAADGRLLWQVRTGSYVYSPAAIQGQTAYVGSYDHRLYALDIRTGAVRWTFDGGAPISGAPTVLDGLVYASTCGSCSKFESNPHARRTFALDTRTGKVVWRFGDGEYSPVVADRSHVYLTGYTSLYGLAPIR